MKRKDESELCAILITVTQFDAFTYQSIVLKVGYTNIPIDVNMYKYK